MSVTVVFESEIVGIECDRPEDDEVLRQSVQDAIGHTGAVVTEIIYYNREDD